MTAEELERFNGENGTPLYLAVHGRIYDVSARPTLYGIELWRRSRKFVASIVKDLLCSLMFLPQGPAAPTIF